MSWFKKKQKITEEEKEVIDAETKLKGNSTYEYRVYLKDVHGSSTKKLKPFLVKRWIDENTGTVYLLNERAKFREEKPEDSDEWRIYKLEDVKLKIATIEKELSKEIKKDDPKINKKNLEYDLGIYKNFKRSLELQGRGSYLNYDDDNVPYFVFRRKGNFKLPEFDNIELDTLYTPSEANIKEASELIEMKREKYSKFKANFGSIMSLFFVLLLLFAGLEAWYSLKLNAQYDSNAINQFQIELDETAIYCAKKYGEAGENFYQSSINVKNITETLVKDLNKKQTVIDGIIPN